MAKKKQKQANKKRFSFLKKINFRSRKVQFAIVLVSFGLIGGAYMLYQSSAATNVASKWAQELTSSSSEKIKETGTSKNGVVVAVLKRGKTLEWNVPGNTLSPSSKYRVCFTAKGMSVVSDGKTTVQVTQIKGVRLGGDGFNKTYTINVNSSADYATYCTNAFTGWGRDTARVRLTNASSNSNRITRVGLIFIEKQ